MKRTALLMGLAVAVCVAGNVRNTTSLVLGRTQDLQPEMALHLGTETDLSCFSIEVAYGGDGAPFAASDVVCNMERFPWAKRGVMVSVDEKRHRLVFSVVDLTGQNRMVAAGDGWLLKVALSRECQLSIVKATALDTRGNAVKLTTVVGE